jgi:hypothetical protein
MLITSPHGRLKDRNTISRRLMIIHEILYIIILHI